jgi:hypothetical protein
VHTHSQVTQTASLFAVQLTMQNFHSSVGVGERHGKRKFSKRYLEGNGIGEGSNDR